jgi:DNA-binding transcriptional ArsR family regulator
MARAATTADAFNAVAEPRRRQILDALAGGERPVNDLVGLLGVAQPQVSKHLRVLREVGAVDVRDEGRQRLYRLNGHALKPIHDWVKNYERLWSDRFEELDVVLEELKRKEEKMDAVRSSGKAELTLPTDEQILITREFNAPKHEGIPDADEHAAVNTATFTEVDGRTTLAILVEHPTKQGRDAQINSGMEAGLQDALDLLEEVAISLR